MDDPKISDSLSEEEISEESDAIEDNTKGDANNPIWKINYTEEYNFWVFLQKNRFTYEPIICPTCNIANLEITVTKKKIY